MKLSEKPYNKYILIAVLSLFCLITYSNTFNSPFVFDGVSYIVENASIRNISDLKSIWSFYPARSLTFLTFAFNYSLHGLNPQGYHIVNLIIHLCSSLLVWWLAMLIFQTPRVKDKPISRYSCLIAFLSALVFTVHPIQTQSVTYIYQRSTIMVSMFYLLSLCLYVRARLSHANKTTFLLCYAGSLITASLGMFTKETMFTLPLVILLFELCFFKPSKKHNLRYIMPFLLLLLVVPLTIFLTRTVHFKKTGIFADKNIMLLPSYYILTQFRVFITYIKLILFPINQNLDYDYPIYHSLLQMPVLLSALFVAVIIGIGIRLFKRQPLLSFCILWFFITLLPESSIITLNDVINEHRLYLPMAGASIFLITMLYYLLNKRPQFMLAVILIILLFYSSLTYFRNIIWKDELTLWSDTVEKSPNKARVYNGRGVAYINKGQYDKALADFSRALEINSNYANIYYNRAYAYTNKDEHEKAISDYSEAIKINPRDKEAYNNRGAAYGQKGQYDKAISDFTAALILNSKNSDLYNNRGTAFMKKGLYDDAISDFTEAIKIDPDYARAYCNRGTAYKEKNQYDKAISDYTEAIRANPKDAKAYNNRGVTRAVLKEYEKAISDYAKAIEIDEGYLDAYNNRAIAYTKTGQYDKAISDYTQILTIEPDYAKAYYGRGTVYCSKGEFDKAWADIKKSEGLGFKSDPEFIERLRSLSKR